MQVCDDLCVVNLKSADTMKRQVKLDNLTPMEYHSNEKIIICVRIYQDYVIIKLVVVIRVEILSFRMEMNVRFGVYPDSHGALITFSSVDSPHRGQWHEALMYSLIYTWTISGANTRDAGDLRRHRAHYDVTVMTSIC